MSEFSRTLHSYRIRSRMTLRAFCLATKANSAYWSQLERGHAPAPEESYFYQKIKEVLNLSDQEYKQLLIMKKDHTWEPDDFSFF